VEQVEQVVATSLTWLKLVIEVIGAIVIAWGCFSTALEIVQRARGHQNFSFTSLRLRLGRFLAMGLEYQLAADIIGTAIAPSWEQLGKLAAIATIRTALNFFLNLELEKEAPVSNSEAAAPLPVSPARA
jgi:uncharacterized membrane protein